MNLECAWFRLFLFGNLGLKNLLSEGRFVLSIVPGRELVSMLTNGQLKELGFMERSKAAKFILLR